MSIEIRVIRKEKRKVRAGVINYAGREWCAGFLVGLDQVDVCYPKHDRQCLFVFDNGRFLGAASPVVNRTEFVYL